MVICNNCCKYFKYDYLLNNHIEKCVIKRNKQNYDIKYKKIDNEINNTLQLSLKQKTLCLFCNTILLNKGNLSRHIQNSCIIKKELENKKNNIIIEKRKK
jgi:hypothetical protein